MVFVSFLDGDMVCFVTITIDPAGPFGIINRITFHNYM